MQTLFTTSGQPFFAQPGVVYHCRGDKDLKCLFSSQDTTPGNKRQYKVHEMTFFKDFLDVLKTLGFMPEVSVKKTIDLELKVKELEAKLAEAKAKKVSEEAY